MDDIKRFTSDQADEILNWFKNRPGNDRGCPACGKANFALADHFGALLSMGLDATIHVDKVFPCLVVTCGECGHLMLFSAKKFLMPAVKPASEEKDVAHAE